jgi:hypothetical protein
MYRAYRIAAIHHEQRTAPRDPAGETVPRQRRRTPTPAEPSTRRDPAAASSEAVGVTGARADVTA